MSHPLNAIPAHPAMAAQQAAAAAEPAPVPAPTVSEAPSQEAQVASMWDAFDVPQSASPSPSTPAPAQTPAIQPPPAPPPPPDLPPTVEELLGGGVSAPAPVTPPAVETPQAVPAQVPQQAYEAPDPGVLQKQAIDYLMANDYRLSDEDRTRLISAPDEVLPRLAAQMHVGIATHLARQVAEAIPAMIQQHLDTHVKAQRAEMEFFSQYPKLNREEWKPVIAESLAMIKQMKPQATRQDVIREGAALAAFRINSQYGNRYQPQPPQPPRGPVQPYVPVAAGGGMAPPTNPAENNIWFELGQQDWNTW